VADPALAYAIRLKKVGMLSAEEFMSTKVVVRNVCLLFLRPQCFGPQAKFHLPAARRAQMLVFNN
jgi:hypothetical protein